MPDDQTDADDAEQKPQHLAPGQGFAEEQRRESRGEDRIGRDDQAAETGRNRLQAGVAEAEDQHTREREAGREQDQRRAIGDADLAGDEGEAPEQAEQADIERQRIEAGPRRGNRDRGRDGHETSPSLPDLGWNVAIWKLNDRLKIS